ncbi:hypothetical protein KAR91_52225 [Candidatus Pacearchaeota archaeon]|nr:hypothetical protein [Candidatus Pacearchaeota archaeon]
MKYKLINTANTDLHLPTVHTKKKEGVMGAAGSLPKKIIIPGLARVEDGKNFVAIEEDELRSLFGLFESVKPGVINRSKPMSISPENVKYNTRILDTGRLIVTDEYGKHVFGVGGAAYQKSALDSVKSENEMLKDKLSTLTQVLVNEGFTEEQAKAIIDNKAGRAQEILKKKEIGIRSTVKENISKSELEPSPLEAAKEFFKDSETVNVLVGNEVVGEYKVKSISNAIKKITKLAAEAGVEVQYDEAGLPFFTDAENRLVKLG